MQITKPIIKICAFLLILPSLLLPNLSVDAHRAIAQASLPGQAATLPSGIPLDFYQHLPYKPYSKGLATRLSWEVDIDFQHIDIPEIIKKTKKVCMDTKKILCQKWVFRVEQKKNPDSDWHVTDEFIQSIPCRLQGNVQILAGKASFNPQTQDHLRCQVPSFEDVANEMAKLKSYGSKKTGLPIELHGVCTSCIDPWAAADIKVSSTGQGNYPVFYLQAKLEIAEGYKPIFKGKVEAAHKNRGYFNTHISAWASSEFSTPFVLTQPQTIWAGMNPKHFVNTLRQRNQQHSNLWTQFWAATGLTSYVNEQNIDSQDWLSWVESNEYNQAMTSETQAYEMSTGPMTLYIGFNPNTQEYFSGTMYNVGVDPACVGY